MNKTMKIGKRYLFEEKGKWKNNYNFYGIPIKEYKHYWLIKTVNYMTTISKVNLDIKYNRAILHDDMMCFK